MRRLIAASVCLTVTGLGLAAAAPAMAADARTATAAPIYQVVNPASQASLVNPSRTEADRAKSTYGFTVDNGVVFQAPTAATTGLNAVVRLFNATSGGFLWTGDATEARSRPRAQPGRRPGHEQPASRTLRRSLLSSPRTGLLPPIPRALARQLSGIAYR